MKLLFLEEGVTVLSYETNWPALPFNNLTGIIQIKQTKEKRPITGRRQTVYHLQSAGELWAGKATAEEKPMLPVVSEWVQSPENASPEAMNHATSPQQTWNLCFNCVLLSMVPHRMSWRMRDWQFSMRIIHGYRGNKIFLLKDNTFTKHVVAMYIIWTDFKASHHCVLFGH